MIPRKLQNGSLVRIIAPSRSLALPWLTDEILKRAETQLNALGLQVEFGKHVFERDDMDSSTIMHRVQDIHAAYADRKVGMILAGIGGNNCNQLLSYIDFDLLRNNPKIFCGFSDITILLQAVYVQTGCCTYYGPNFWGLGEDAADSDRTMEWFRRCLMSEEQFIIRPNERYSDIRPTEICGRQWQPNHGPVILQDGEAEGHMVVGNLCTMNLLQGTIYFPSLQGTILCIEDDFTTSPAVFDRQLQSLLHQSGAKHLKALLIGRFERQSGFSIKMLGEIINSKSQLNSVPVIANLDFGHTVPRCTLPIGGRAKIMAHKGIFEWIILEH